MQQVQEMSSEMCLWQIAAYSPGPMSLVMDTLVFSIVLCLHRNEYAQGSE